MTLIGLPVKPPDDDSYGDVRLRPAAALPLPACFRRRQPLRERPQIFVVGAHGDLHAPSSTSTLGHDEASAIRPPGRAVDGAVPIQAAGAGVVRQPNPAHRRDLDQQRRGRRARRDPRRRGRGGSTVLEKRTASLAAGEIPRRRSSAAGRPSTPAARQCSRIGLAARGGPPRFSGAPGAAVRRGLTSTSTSPATLTAAAGRAAGRPCASTASRPPVARARGLDATPRELYGTVEAPPPYAGADAAAARCRAARARRRSACCHSPHADRCPTPSARMGASSPSASAFRRRNVRRRHRGDPRGRRSCATARPSRSTVALLALVVYVYTVEVERRRWGDRCWPASSGRGPVQRDGELGGPPHQRHLRAVDGHRHELPDLIGLNNHLLPLPHRRRRLRQAAPPDRNMRIPGLPNRLVLVFLFSCPKPRRRCCSAGSFHWHYWWWDWPFVPLIVVFGYMTSSGSPRSLRPGRQPPRPAQRRRGLAAVDLIVLLALALAGWL